jgi:hypothetical protein
MVISSSFPKPKRANFWIYAHLRKGYRLVDPVSDFRKSAKSAKKQKMEKL